MNMKRLLTLVAFFATLHASAQQVNPVPDYVFANRMSAGRNTVTDTAAYFSIGPRYGATRGMMPPMVVDTASFSANKRNGLLIFSIQKNKFLYWDSVGVKWAEMAGTGGSAITGSGVAGYMPEFTTATNLDTTRLYHSAGRFAIGSTTTTNGVLNVYGGQSYFDTSLRVGASTLFVDEANDRIGMGTTSPAMKLQVNGTAGTSGSGILLAPNDVGIWTKSANEDKNYRILYTGTLNHTIIGGSGSGTRIIDTAGNVRLFINSSGKTLISGTVDGGAYNLQVTGGFILGSGDLIAGQNGGKVGINSTAPASILEVGDQNPEITVTSYKNIVNATDNEVLNSILFKKHYGVNNGGAIRLLQSSNSFTNAHLTFLTNLSGSLTERMRIKDDGEILLGYTADQGTYILQANGNALISGNIRTAAPAGGTANDWRLGTVATVSPTSPNRTIEVSIGGTIYYIAAKTTND